MRFALVVVVFASLAAWQSGCGDDGGGTPKIDAATSNQDADLVCFGGKSYLETCTMTSECGNCMCQNFGHSMVCTKMCTGDGDCPAPSGGCTQGFCRP